MTGIVLAGMGAGTFIMPPIINQLIAAYDWRMTYIIMGGVVLVVTVAAAQFMKRDPSKIGRQPYGEEGSRDRDSKTEDVGFSLREAAKTVQFWQVACIYLCAACCIFSILVHISPHATDIGISSTTATTTSTRTSWAPAGRRARWTRCPRSRALSSRRSTATARPTNWHGAPATTSASTS